MMNLAKRLMREGTPAIPLPLTDLGRRSIPCHPVEEMDTPEIEGTIKRTRRGLIETFSEDEAFDLFGFLQRSELNQDHNFDIACLYEQEVFYVAYCKKELDTETNS